MPMALGRGFHSGEDRSPVVVLSYSLWRRQFNGDAAILSKTVSLSGKMFTVIGVTMPGFHGINRLFNVRVLGATRRRRASGGRCDEGYG